MPLFIEIDDDEVSISIPKKQVERLIPLHFRGHKVAKAGNFCRDNWHGPYDALKAILPELREEISEALKEDDFETRSFEVALEQPVGWSSTAPLPEKHEFLELFHPNRRSSALRFRSDAPTKAALTNLLSVAYQLRENRDGLYVVIYTLYPGPDIGELEGDISSAEKIAFFDWEHPGAPLSA